MVTAAEDDEALVHQHVVSGHPLVQFHGGVVDVTFGHNQHVRAESQLCFNCVKMDLTPAKEVIHLMKLCVCVRVCLCVFWAGISEQPAPNLTFLN